MLQRILLLLLWNFGADTAFYKARESRNEVKKRDYSVCDTKECKNVAEFILRGMNQSVDPCEDFYTYVCGSRAIEYPVPPTKKEWGIHEMVAEEVRINIKNILDEDIDSSDNRALKLEKQWYRACMDEDRLREIGFDKVAWFVENIGGWPMARDYTEWNETEFPWQKVSQYFTKLVGEYSLFSIGVQPDPTNSDLNILTLNQASDILFSPLLSIGDDPESDQLNEEKKLLKKVALAYAKSRMSTRENVNEETEQVIEFKKMLMMTESAESESDPIPMTIDELQIFYDENDPGDYTGKIDWLEMVRGMLMDSGVKVNGDERILITDIKYIQNLVQLLKRTPQRTIVNYIHWTFIQASLNYLDKEKRQWNSDMVNTLYGISRDIERWEYCWNHMPLVEGSNAAYVKKYFPDSTKDTATKLAEKIREGMKLQIFHSDWMDEETKLLAIEKLEVMKFHIGYPESYKNESYLNEVYEGLQLGPNYFNNVLHYLKYGTEKGWRSFKSRLDKNEFLMQPTTVNAAYYLPDNALTLTAAELKLPLFSSKLPESVNYGSIGFTIGHEISHAFDDTGRKYDKNGNRLLWWSEMMINKYEEKVKCFVDQFNNYKINGKRTAGENIADTSGLITAFEVYKNYIKEENLKDERLPGLQNLNGEQLYFVSFGASFCSSVTPEYEEKLKKMDVHASSFSRINGAVSNTEGFSRVFRCPKNSPMNPDLKCNIFK